MSRSASASPLTIAAAGATTRLFSQAKRSHSRPWVTKYSSSIARLTAAGPALPFGRSARSTRNTLPSSVTSPISACSVRATWPKYSWPVITPRPSGPPAVGPSSS